MGWIWSFAEFCHTCGCSSTSKWAKKKHSCHGCYRVIASHLTQVITIVIPCYIHSASTSTLPSVGHNLFQFLQDRPRPVAPAEFSLGDTNSCIGCVKSPPCSGYIVQSQSDRIGNLARVLLIVQMLVCNTLLIWGNHLSVKIGYTRSSWFLMVSHDFSWFIDVYHQFPIFTLFIDGNNWRAIEPCFHRRTAWPQEQCTWSQGIAASGGRFLGVVSGSASWLVSFETFETWIFMGKEWCKMV